jgi:hypothetical protein
MDATLRRRMVQDLSNRLDAMQASFDSDELRRTRSLLLTWKSWSCRVLRLLYGAEEAGRFELLLTDEIESTRSAREWVQHAKRCLERLEVPTRRGFLSTSMHAPRVLVSTRGPAQALRHAS